VYRKYLLFTNILVLTKILFMINHLTILGEPRRQRILKLVWSRDVSAGDIANDLSDISFGAVSQHLGILFESGLVTVRKEGRSRIYRANRADMGALEAYLNEFW
jgi:DNA-binding transcriptional ArsR family regulator